MKTSTAEKLEPVVLADIHKPVKDIVGISPGIWPGNTAHRIGSYYLSLRTLDLEQGQTGKFSSLPEFWVFERADIHGLEPPDRELKLEIILGNSGTVGTFVIPEGKNHSLCKHRQSGLAGSYLGNQDILLKLHSDPPKEGRIVINFCGYLIEPWR